MRKRRHRGTRRQAHATELSERRCPGQPRVSQSQCRILAAGTAPGTCQERGQSLWSEGRNTSFALPTQAATTLPPSCPDPELSTTCVCRLAPSVLGPHRSLPPPSSLGTQKSSSQHCSGPATLHSPPCYLSRRLSACSVFKDTAATPSRGFKTPTPPTHPFSHIRCHLQDPCCGCARLSPLSPVQVLCVPVAGTSMTHTPPAPPTTSGSPHPPGTDGPAMPFTPASRSPFGA